MTDPNAILTQRMEVAPGLLIIRVTPDQWELPDFKPGQFTVLGLPGSAPRFVQAGEEPTPPADPDKLIKRAYSIASSSQARSYLEFYVALVSTGALTPRLFALTIGNRLWLSPKITGMLTLEEVPEGSHIVLVATGTGLAPYMSMIRTFVQSRSDRRFAVIHGAYHSWDLGYRDELMTLARICPSFVYLPTLSHPHEEPVPWHGHSGFVQSVWTDGTLAEALGFDPGPDTTHVYLCGNPLMIEDMVSLLNNRDFIEHTRKQAGTIHVERYW
jgi:ferredoxin--NADP+ reductase